MAETNQSLKSRCSQPTSGGLNQLLPMFTPEKEDDEVCCGPRQAPRSSPSERPGYRIRHFVEDFINTPVGPVPRIKTRLNFRDRLGTLSVRAGFNRNNYKVAPGLYAVGRPEADSLVLVTANYKLTFDTLRQELEGLDAWLLVLDTRGVNVWCAAGKKNFSGEEIILQIKKTRLEQVVAHRKLILPQLSATGVSAQQVKRGCGFEVIWGPIRAGDIKAFLAAGLKTEKTMRRVTFNFTERLVLTPVEVTQVMKPLLWILPLMFFLSGLGPEIFSLGHSWNRGLAACLAVLLGIAGGAVFTPAALPWLPFRAFYLKGALTGFFLGLALILVYSTAVSLISAPALIILTAAVSSYLAMNFTGCTPYTSPSGVEKEMRQAIPLQAGAVSLGLLLWVISAFVGK
jgi:hypothetical protein